MPLVLGSASGYIEPMRRNASVRLLFSILAFVAASMDPVTKVVHGIVHQREAIESGVVRAGSERTASPLSTVSTATVGAFDSGHSSATTVEHDGDGDWDHRALHEAALINVLPKLLPQPPPALVTVVFVPRTATQTSANVGPSDVLFAYPHSLRVTPSQPRAPPPLPG